VAHRGFSSVRPENTHSAFYAAAEAGFDGYEFDLHTTKDGKWVICHDGTLDRTTSSTGAVGDRTQAQLMALRLREGNGGADVALTDQHLPSLEQVIALCKGKALFNLDKVPPVRFDLVYQAFAEADALEMAMFKGRDFSAEQMTDWCCRLMKEDKELPLFSPLRYSETEQGLKDFRGLSCMMETGQGHSKEIMALAKEVGIGMLTMTALNPSIDKESTWDKLKQDGYSTIMTDEPIRMKEWVEKD